MCEAAGIADVRTYIASGNVVFDEQAGRKGRGEGRPRSSSSPDYAGKPVGVMVRTAAEMAAVLATPTLSRTRAANRTVAIFLDAPRRPTRVDKRASGARTRR